MNNSILRLICMIIFFIIIAVLIFYSINISIDKFRYEKIDKSEKYIDIITSNIKTNDKIIFSLTTSPKRILKMKPVIDSILNQKVVPDMIRINIPKRFKRTNEKYIIPDFIKNNSRIKIFEYDEDYGPIMKILPTIMEYKDRDDVIIIYGDDDVLLLPNLIENYIKFIKYDPRTIYCLSGINYNKNKNFDILVNVDIPEGYMTVCLKSNIFKHTKMSIIDYFNQIKDNKDCFQSDDLTLGNYYAMNDKDVNQIFTNKINFYAWWDLDLDILGNGGDGLKDLNKGGHKNAYKRSYEYLKSKNLNFI